MKILVAHLEIRDFSLDIHYTKFGGEFCNKKWKTILHPYDKTIFSFSINAVLGQNQLTISNEAISETYRAEEITNTSK